MKHSRLIYPSSVALACLIAVATAHTAAACNIPVFRYALERWRIEGPEDLYDAIVFTNGELTIEQQAALAALQQAAYESPADTAPAGTAPADTAASSLPKTAPSRANLAVHVVDLNGEMPKPIAKLWREQQQTTEAAAPWLVLRYPDSGDDWPSVWSGPLTGENVALLIDSPARRELVKRLMAGQSVVWLLLESGDAAADGKAAEEFDAQLKQLPGELKLPEGAGEDGTPLLSTLPLAIRFSLLRVNRAEPSEKLFAASLLAGDKRLQAATGPIVFPVFGRGRVLDGLYGKDLKPEVVADAAAFLCGACSCLVKRLNPGFDLLTTAAWDNLLDAATDEALELPWSEKATEAQLVHVPQAPVKAETPVEPETPTRVESVDNQMKTNSETLIFTTSTSFPWQPYALAAAAALVLITGLILASSLRKQSTLKKRST